MSSFESLILSPTMIPSTSAGLLPSPPPSLLQLPPLPPQLKPTTATEFGACPAFCGRIWIDRATKNASTCQACPWGQRASNRGFCSECGETLELYSWMYLLFFALLPALIHCYHVRRSMPVFKTNQLRAELLEYGCIVIECVIAAIAALLLFPPYGSLNLRGCTATKLKQWYPWMYNPTLKFDRTLPCAHEIVYPLQSLPFVYLLFCLFNTLVLRTILYGVYMHKIRPARSFFAALFTLPLLGLANALLSGIAYHLFPYILAMYTVGAQAILFAHLRPQSRPDLWQKMFCTPKQLAFLLIHSFLFAFSIITMCIRIAPDDPTFMWIFLPLIIVPPAFFFATVYVTHPFATVPPNLP